MILRVGPSFSINMLKWHGAVAILIFTLTANHIIGKEIDEIEKELLGVIDGMEKAKVDAHEASAGLFEEDKPQNEEGDAVLSIDRAAVEEKAETERYSGS